MRIVVISIKRYLNGWGVYFTFPDFKIIAYGVCTRKSLSYSGFYLPARLLKSFRKTILYEQQIARNVYFLLFAISINYLVNTISYRILGYQLTNIAKIILRAIPSATLLRLS